MASPQQLYITYDASTAANYRTTMQAISLQLDAMGFTKTADTGQVDWTTTPAVPANHTSPLFEIRIPASDPLQTGSTQYFIRINYAVWNTLAGPTVDIQLGTGTNGAGTLTGFVTSSSGALGTPPGNTGTTAFECDFSWDASRLGMLLWRNTTATASGSPQTFLFAIERTKSILGADTVDGVTILWNNGQNGSGVRLQQTIIFGIGLTANTGQFLSIGSAGVTTDVFNNQIPISPVFPDWGKFGNPMTVVATGRSADIAEGAFLQTTLYGSTRTYICTKIAATYGNCGPNNATSSALLMRFD